MRTYVPRARAVEELTQSTNWHVLNADGQVLGRLATQIARLLIGKDKPNFTPYLDCGDHVVVINARENPSDRQQDRTEDLPARTADIRAG